LFAISRLAEERITSLAYVLEPADRAAFVAAAAAAIQALSPGATGPGSIHRTVAKVWRDHFRPPTQTAPIEPRALDRDEEGDAPRRDRRHGRAMATQPKPIMWRGLKYSSRNVLAQALAPLCGDREPGAISGMLVKLNDNGDAVIAHYQGKAKPKSANFAPPP
jgi:hypothetical protein